MSSLTPPSRMPTPPIFGGYRPLPGVFDESRDPEGKLRPAWGGFVEKVETLGPSVLRERHESALQLLREHGV